MPEESFRKLVEAVTEEGKSGRRRLYASVLGPIAVAIIVGLLGLVQARSNGETLTEARTVADYVRDCLQHPEELTLAQRTERCGQEGNGAATFVRYFNCALQISPEARTDENLNECAQRAFAPR